MYSFIKSTKEKIMKKLFLILSIAFALSVIACEDPGHDHDHGTCDDPTHTH